MEKWNTFYGYEHRMDFIKKVVLEISLMPKDIFFQSGYSFSHFRKIEFPETLWSNSELDVRSCLYHLLSPEDEQHSEASYLVQRNFSFIEDDLEGL